MTIKPTIFSILLYFTLLPIQLKAQDVIPEGKKGSLSISWGWNWSDFSGSDIHFKGQGHDFTLYNVQASNRQSEFDFNTYFVHFTTPQYNFKISYFFDDHWNVSFGVDHMKYIMNQYQYSTISGNINTGSSYDGSYQNTPIQLTEDFLTFEHTDGLNYIFFGLNRFDELFNFQKISGPNIGINITEGFSTGFYLPKTNSQLLGGTRYDEFHVSGFGFDANVGLNISFFNYFFIEGELKGGYVNMPDIRSTTNKSDYAEQDFFYSQYNIMLGANIPLKSKNN